MMPITHQCAGLSVPIPVKRAAQFALNQEAIDPDFLQAAPMIRKCLGFGIEQNMISENQLAGALTQTPVGSPQQAAKVDGLLNNINDVYRKKLETKTQEWALFLGSDFDLQDSYWNHSFSIDVRLDDEDDYLEAIDETSTGYLVCEKVGVELLEFDLAEFPEAFSSDLIQLISYACLLSMHITGLQAMQDDMMCWLGGTAELAELSEEDIEDILTRLDNNESLESFVGLVTDSGSFEYEIDVDCIELDVIYEYLKGKQLANKLNKTIDNKLTRNNAKKLLQRFKQNPATPPGILKAITLLCTATYWDQMTTDTMVFRGDTPINCLSPVGFGIPFENTLYRDLHSVSMQGGDRSFFGIELTPNSDKQLLNIQLGEQILGHLYNHFTEATE